MGAEDCHCSVSDGGGHGIYFGVTDLSVDCQFKLDVCCCVTCVTIKRGQVLPQLYVWMFCIDVEVLREREREKYTVIRMCCCLNHTVSFISFHYLGTGIVIILSHCNCSSYGCCCLYGVKYKM